jgi:hypothetical protein
MRRRCCCGGRTLGIPNLPNSVCKLPNAALWLSTPYGDFEFHPFDSRSWAPSPWWGLYAVAVLPAAAYGAGGGARTAADVAGCTGGDFKYMVTIRFTGDDLAALEPPQYAQYGAFIGSCPDAGGVNLGSTRPLVVRANSGSQVQSGRIARPPGYADSCDPLLIPLRFHFANNSHTSGNGYFAGSIAT